MEYHPYFSYRSQQRHKYASELFQSYGSPCTVDIKPEVIGSPTPLTSRHTRCINRLSARQPCCPLKPPNRVIDELSRQEPCMSKILDDNAKFKKKFQSLMEYFNQVYGKTNSRSDTRLKRDMKVFTQRVKALNEKKIAGISEEELQIEKEDIALELGKHSTGFLELWSELLQIESHIKKSNHQYSGGLLSCESVSPTDRDAVALYTGGSSLRTLYCSKIGCIEDGEPTIINTEHVEVDQNIFQIDSRVLNNIVCCLGRHKTSTFLYKIQHHDDSSLHFTLVENSALDQSDNLSSISLSPYLEDEYVVATEGGDVYLNNCKQGASTKLVHCDHNFDCHDPYWECSWGMHPREICMTNRTGVLVYDIRLPGTTPAIDLFALPHPLLNTKERVFISKSHPRNSHYRILSTDKTIVLTDQRFTNHPVLHWRHLLPTPPSYIDICCDVTDSVDMVEDVLLLGSQLSGELHCMQMTMKNCPGNAPAWTCVPWRTSPIRDMYRYTSDEGLVVDPLVVERRLKAPLAGIAALQLSKKQGFTALQLTSLGDLFYQSYTPSQHQTDKTKTYGFGSKNINISQKYLDTSEKWLKEAEALLDKHRCSDSSKGERTVVKNSKRTVCDIESVGDNKTDDDDSESEEDGSDDKGAGDNMGSVGDNREDKDDSSQKVSVSNRGGGGDGLQAKNVGIYAPGYTTDVSDIFNDLSLTNPLSHAACSLCRTRPDLTLEPFTCTVCSTDTHLSRRLSQGVQMDFVDIESSSPNALDGDVLSETNLEPPNTYSAMLLKLWEGEPITKTDLQNREAEWLVKNQQVKEEIKTEEESSSSLSDLSDSDDADDFGPPGLPTSQNSLFSMLGLSSFNTNTNITHTVEDPDESVISEIRSFIDEQQPDGRMLHGDQVIKKGGSDHGEVKEEVDHTELDQVHKGGGYSLCTEDIKTDLVSSSTSATAETTDVSIASSSEASGILSFIGLDRSFKDSATGNKATGRPSTSSQRKQHKPPRKRHRRSSTSSIGSLSSQISVQSYASSVLGFGVTPTKLRQTWFEKRAKPKVASPWSRQGDGSMNTGFSMSLPHGRQSPTVFQTSTAKKKKKRKSVMGF